MSDDYKQELQDINKKITQAKVQVKQGFLAKLLSQKKNSEGSEINTSFYETSDEKLLEQCFDGEKTYFAVYDKITEEITYQDQYDDNGIIIKPLMCEEVLKEHIKLPSKAEDYKNEKELDLEISHFIDNWLDIDSKYKRFAIYNIRKSWVYDRFHSLNYLRALGDYGTGKSRFDDTIGYIHYKPIATSGALTSAVLFRIIEKWKGTLIIDEADFKNTDESQDVVKIINQGYEKGRPVMRVDKDDHNKIDFFEVYCPKVISTRKEFEDKATESRCMTEVMRQTNRKDIPPNLTAGFWKETRIIRNKLLLWRFRNYNKIDADAGQNVDLGDIEPRLRQINVGFVALFMNDSEALEDFKKFLQNYSKELIDSRAETIEGRIVKAICGIIIEERDLTAKNIIQQAELKDKNGNLWESRSISSKMKGLGFPIAKTQRVYEGTAKVYPYIKENILMLAKKYLSDVELLEKIKEKCYDVTDVTNVTESVGNVSLDQFDTSRRIHNNGNIGNTVTDYSENINKNLPSFFSNYPDMECPITEFINNFSQDTLAKALQNGEVCESKAGYIRLNL